MLFEKSCGVREVHVGKAHLNMNADNFKLLALNPLAELLVKMQAIKQKHGILASGNADRNPVVIGDHIVVLVGFTDTA